MVHPEARRSGGGAAGAAGYCRRRVPVSIPAIQAGTVAHAADRDLSPHEWGADYCAGGVTLYGVREALVQDGWTIDWRHPMNKARAWKTSEGELLLQPGSATVPRLQHSQQSIQFTPAIVLQGERLYAPASFFQQLMGQRLRIDMESGRLLLQRE